MIRRALLLALALPFRCVVHRDGRLRGQRGHATCGALIYLLVVGGALVAIGAPLGVALYQFFTSPLGALVGAVIAATIVASGWAAGADHPGDQGEGG